MSSIILKQLKRIHNHFVSDEQFARSIGVNIGEHCLISTRRWSSEPYLITIGNHVQVTDNVIFHTHGGGHVLRRQIPDFDSFGKIVIKDYAYIGAWSHIMPGVTIGEGSLVAAGSIVTKSVPSGVVVGGAPAKVICTVEEYKQKNMQYNVHSKNMNRDEKKSYLLSLSEKSFIAKPYMRLNDL